MRKPRRKGARAARGNARIVVIGAAGDNGIRNLVPALDKVSFSVPVAITLVDTQTPAERDASIARVAAGEKIHPRVTDLFRTAYVQVEQENYGELFRAIDDALDDDVPLVFYLSISPTAYPGVLRLLSPRLSGKRNAFIAIEKPIACSYREARDLRRLASTLHLRVVPIDHYLYRWVSEVGSSIAGHGLLRHAFKGLRRIRLSMLERAPLPEHRSDTYLGAFLDLAVHMLSVLRVFCQAAGIEYELLAKAHDIKAVRATHRPGSAYETYAALQWVSQLKGCTVVLEVGKAAKGGDEKLLVANATVGRNHGAVRVKLDILNRTVEIRIPPLKPSGVPLVRHESPYRRVFEELLALAVGDLALAELPWGFKDSLAVLKSMDALGHALSQAPLKTYEPFPGMEQVFLNE